MSMKYETTAKRIRKALSDADMSAKELSERTGVREASISQYVNGYHAPSNLSAGKIGGVLGVNPLWLMGFDVPMHEDLSNGQAVSDLSQEDRALLDAYHDAPEIDKKMIRRILRFGGLIYDVQE